MNFEPVEYRDLCPDRASIIVAGRNAVLDAQLAVAVDPQAIVAELRQGAALPLGPPISSASKPLLYRTAPVQPISVASAVRVPPSCANPAPDAWPPPLPVQPIMLRRVATK